MEKKKLCVSFNQWDLGREWEIQDCIQIKLNQAILLYRFSLLSKANHILNRKLKFRVFKEGAGSIRERIGKV